jgi:hypothetical protein
VSRRYQNTLAEDIYVRAGQLEVTDVAANVAANNFAKFVPARRSADAREVLEEVFELLEDYGPVFYTEELHNRIVAALMPAKM